MIRPIKAMRAKVESNPETIQDLADVPPSIIRTFVPIVVNGLLMVGLDGVIANDALWAIASAGVAIGYYIIVRILETVVSPNFGALIFSRAKPKYNKPVGDPPIAEDLTPPEDVVSSGDEEGFPDEYLWMLQEGRSDPDENAAIGADDREWLAAQPLITLKPLFPKD